jgi:hypothetical protein
MIGPLDARPLADPQDLPKREKVKSSRRTLNYFCDEIAEQTSAPSPAFEPLDYCALLTQGLSMTTRPKSTETLRHHNALPAARAARQRYRLTPEGAEGSRRRAREYYHRTMAALGIKTKKRPVRRSLRIAKKRHERTGRR